MTPSCPYRLIVPVICLALAGQVVAVPVLLSHERFPETGHSRTNLFQDQAINTAIVCVRERSGQFSRKATEAIFALGGVFYNHAPMISAEKVHEESVREKLYVPLGGAPGEQPYFEIEPGTEAHNRQFLRLRYAIRRNLPWGERLSVFSGNVVLGYVDYRKLSSLLILDYLHINALLRGLGIDDYLLAALIEEAIQNDFTAIASKYEHFRVTKDSFGIALNDGPEFTWNKMKEMMERAISSMSLLSFYQFVVCLVGAQ